ncbi:MAG: threonine/serine dehydratase [Bacteroidota bacterium]
MPYPSPSASLIQEASEQIAPYIMRTPVEHSPWLGQATETEVYLKMEHLQRSGSFKLRGAAFRLLNLSQEQKAQGIITASTGNHAAAVAYMARQIGVKVHIFLPTNTTTNKLNALQFYEVELHLHGQDSIEAEQKARQVAAQQGLPFVSPYNDPWIMAGQGTLAQELIEQLPDLDAVFVPVGGGGLIGGMATYLKAVQPHLHIVGVQPENSAVMYESLKAGHIVDLTSYPTLSDGTAGGVEHDTLTFDPCQNWVDEWQLVSEEEIKQGLLFLLEHHQLMVEGAAALSVAAFRVQAEKWMKKKVALILCGRKMSLATLRNILG